MLPLTFILLTVTQLTSQTVVWNGSTNNNWNIASNWNGGILPSPNDTAEIGNLNSVILTGNNVTIKKLILNARATLTVDDPNVRLDIIGSNDIGLQITLRANLMVEQGTVSISNTTGDGIYADDRSTIINHGSLFVNSFGEEGLHLDRASTVDNYGLFTIDQLNGITPTQCVFLEDGTITNFLNAEIFVSTCASNLKPMMTIVDGSTYDDSGESLYFVRNCN